MLLNRNFELKTFQLTGLPIRNQEFEKIEQLLKGMKF